MSIISSGHEVVGNFDFMTFDDGVSTFTFQIDNLTFVTELTFKNDSDTSNATFDFRQDGTKFYFTMINFNDTFGNGNIEPIMLGDIDGRELSVRFWVNKLGSKAVAKQVKFTFYLERDNDV
ncbi:hypothetical protein J7I06_004470 [Vibrio vulnificus]|uniref:DUF6864 domain-containing function n=1 Tax=Vibrio vulnificus TaxID=672 RepID=UPI000CD1AA5E|nr:hypothetical protein [Vibrio vulnificus]EHH0805005.1 hypothetical protein [Vibrio vulnificus]POC19257.1 hypothetical protein CRN42_14115 [Vibrio vulnificus]